MEQEDRLPEAKRALVDFLGRFGAGDRVGITVFNTEAYELSPLTEIGPKRGELISQVEGLFPAGDTRLYDTTAESYEKLNAEPAGDRIRALVVLTDGRDNLSQTTLDGLLERLRMTGEGASSTKVFAIAYGSDADSEALENIAESTGAKGYQSDPEAIEAVYDDIATFF
jgi:Ca-activated chloride channel family protein